jgi:hypothetical protein
MRAKRISAARVLSAGMSWVRTETGGVRRPASGKSSKPRRAYGVAQLPLRERPYCTHGDGVTHGEYRGPGCSMSSRVEAGGMSETLAAIAEPDQFIIDRDRGSFECVLPA